MQKIENKKFEENNDISFVLDIIFEYIRHWKWFLLSVFVCLSIAVIQVLTTPKKYNPSLSILLNDEKSRKSSSSKGPDLNALMMMPTINNLDNEIALFKSSDLISNVVDSLNLTTSYYVDSFFKKTEIYSESPFHAEMESASNKSPIANIDIKKQGAEYEVVGNCVLSNGEEHEINKKLSEKDFPLSLSLDSDSSVLHITLTGKPAKDEAKYNIIINRKLSAIASVSGGLSVNHTNKNSTILDISMISYNADKGIAIVKELIKQYNEQNVRTNNEVSYNTSLFINERLKQISEELEGAEDEVVNYKQKHNITDLSSEAALFIQQTGQNEQRLQEIETQLNIISLVERFVNDPANKFKVVPNLGITDAALSQIITEYNSKILSNDLLLKGTGEENPSRIRLADEINTMRSGISQSISNVKKSYEISKQDFMRQSKSNLSRVRSVPQQEKGLIEKVRQQQIKESLFLFLMQKREETNLSIASNSEKARTISSIQFGVGPIAPNSRMIILIGLALGFIIPIVVIYLLNLFRTHLRGRDELEKLSEASIIGEICENKSADDLVVLNLPNSAITEMFRSLRNNLDMALQYRNNQMIAVTSTISGEGKSFISINLALAFAVSNRKVLLVGADIRQPKLKEYLNLTYEAGLTNYLIEPERGWRSVIHKTKICSGLDVMVSGVVPPNPNELLMSPALEKFFVEAKQEYDILIVDTAPVGLVSDSYLINKAVDLSLYVVRNEVTPKTAINFINAQKEEDKLNNMYLVYNGSSLDRNYKYGYGKAYGYGEK
ncbi:polysaccharide biosynthesis tyrosine autokinase [Dysgonomonas sp. 511]|uniref:GumC family protein n=1 Tax=Dysgonomonas sp. 511 TaxID=2302930 RepID=UPI0013D0B9D6|nr:polysaccharide biosynthesis tyrosine autokinase [Dysgonomonas sp. 511]NDV78863.1 polysaccharide biosynthesis tyrosine autokinase [Dysgonomonas sp. 511]